MTQEAVAEIATFGNKAAGWDAKHRTRASLANLADGHLYQMQAYFEMECELEVLVKTLTATYEDIVPMLDSIKREKDGLPVVPVGGGHALWTLAMAVEPYLEGGLPPQQAFEQGRRTLRQEIAGTCYGEGNAALVRCLWVSSLEQTLAQNEAAIQDAKAEMYKAQGKYELEAEARKRAEEEWRNAKDAQMKAEKLAALMQGERDAMWRQLNGQDAKILAVVKQGLAQSKANAKKLDGIDDSARRAEDAATDAALQAAKTRAAVENKKREEIHYPHLWDTLQEVKTAEDKGECFTVDHYAEILSQARAKGRRLGKIDERRLRRIRNAWQREGWKNAKELEAGWKAIMRKAKE
jgi:hypothetical protein